MECPSSFTDLRIGDSIATNGVCLTVEAYSPKHITFALGAETLKITGWTAENLKGTTLNLERSLRLGDRIHGHWVSGHVDAVGVVSTFRDLGGSMQLDVQAPAELMPFVWPKGSWAVNGVSLTINDVTREGVVSMCLIPETLARTNLGRLEVGSRVNLEIDTFARGLIHYFQKARPQSLVVAPETRRSDS